MACEGSGVASGAGLGAARDTRTEAVDARISTDSRNVIFFLNLQRFTKLFLVVDQEALAMELESLPRLRR